MARTSGRSGDISSEVIGVSSEVIGGEVETGGGSPSSEGMTSGSVGTTSEGVTSESSGDVISASSGHGIGAYETEGESKELLATVEETVDTDKVNS